MISPSILAADERNDERVPHVRDGSNSEVELAKADFRLSLHSRHPLAPRTRQLGLTDRHRGGLSSPASQPTASDLKGSTTTEILAVRPQVAHSNVRSSNPRSPGEIRAKAIRCLHTGHIGRSLVKPTIYILGLIMTLSGTGISIHLTLARFFLHRVLVD